ncbi:uncharacterized protein [Argopecten irradians]|uniref:uncharacterized protein n=1 Tax=Argopecten irradians TaxID=31199 RepID=UPI0037240F35
MGNKITKKKMAAKVPQDIDRTELWVSRVNAFSSEYDGVNSHPAPSPVGTQPPSPVVPVPSPVSPSPVTSNHPAPSPSPSPSPVVTQPLTSRQPSPITSSHPAPSPVAPSPSPVAPAQSPVSQPSHIPSPVTSIHPAPSPSPSPVTSKSPSPVTSNHPAQSPVVTQPSHQYSPSPITSSHPAQSLKSPSPVTSSDPAPSPFNKKTHSPFTLRRVQDGESLMRQEISPSGQEVLGQFTSPFTTPNIYPVVSGALAIGTQVGFEHKLYIDEVNIYETYHAGSVCSIKARGPDKSWVVIWNGKTEDIHTSRIFKPDIVKTPFQTDEIRVETDCSTSGTWAEIDAIQIVGRKYDFAIPPPEESLSEALEKLVNNWKFSDVQFKVENETFHAHKAIMIVRSDFFDAIFTRNFKEKDSKEPIEFKDISAASFRAMLHFIYTNKIPPNSSCVLLTDLWRVADRFKLNGLQALTVREIASKLDVNNVVDIYMAAIYKLPVIDDLRTVCTDFMRCNMSEVVRTESFMTLHQENVIELIQMMTTKLGI